VCEDDGERLVMLKPHPDLMGTMLEGKYEIRGIVGEGGMGTVYLAHQGSMDRDVAIKVLRPEYCHNRLAIKRFHREARAASRLTHPNTITVYDSGQSEDGLLYQVIELLNGSPLSDILDEEGALDPHRAIRIVAQICDSLAEAHEAGITHRDLKPENIFIEEKFGNPEFVKVLDFGIAKIADANATQATATGMICGTPSYMSPEQAMGRELDGRSDVYSLGILFWELLENKRPYGGDTPMEVMLKHINDPVPRLPEAIKGPVRGHLKELFNWVLAKTPEERPQSCQELKARLLQIAAGTPEGEFPEGAHHTTTMDTAALKPNASGTLNTGLAHSAAFPIPGGGESRAWIGAVALVVAGMVGGAFYLFGSDLLGLNQSGNESAAGASAGSGPAPAPPDTPSEADDAKEGADSASAVPEAPAEPPPAPEPKFVEVRISSDPEGATVVDADGAVLGTTPLVIEREAGSGPMTVTLRREGFQDRPLNVDPAKSLMWAVALAKVQRAPRPAKVRTTSKGAAARKAKSATKKTQSTESSGKTGFGTF